MTKLNKAQLEFIYLFRNDISDEDLTAVKKLVSQYFAEKALNIADKVWKEKGHTEDQLLSVHERTAYPNMSK